MKVRVIAEDNIIISDIMMMMMITSGGFTCGGFSYSYILRTIFGVCHDINDDDDDDYDHHHYQRDSWGILKEMMKMIMMKSREILPPN